MTERRVFCEITNAIILIPEDKGTLFVFLALLARTTNSTSFSERQLRSFANRCLEVARVVSDKNERLVSDEIMKVVELTGGVLHPETVWSYLTKANLTKLERILAVEMSLFLLSFSPKYHSLPQKELSEIIISISKKLLFKESLSRDEKLIVEDANDCREYASVRSKQKFVFLLKTLPPIRGTGITPHRFDPPPRNQIYELGTKVQTLGRGSGGAVVLVRINGKLLAQKRQLVTQESLSELSILSSYKHENIISMDSFSLINGLEINLEVGISLSDIMNTKVTKQEWEDCYNNGFKRVKVLTNEQRRRYQKDICEGMKYLHKNKVLYRDPKLANVIIVEGIAKLADFGLSLERSEDVPEKTTNVYTISNRPPELLYYNHSNYSYPADVWATGTVLLEIETEVLPFSYEYDEDPINGVLDCIFSILDTKFEFLEEDAKNLISPMLVWEPEKRTTFERT